MQPFVYNALPARVIFASGTLSQVGREIQTLGCGKALVLTGPSQSKKGKVLKKDLEDLCVGLYSKATMHAPTNITELAQNLDADCLVVIGGGSAIGSAKAIVLRTDLPQIVIPTSYSGSEVLHIVERNQDDSEDAQKTLKLLPEVIIYDVDLTLTLPVQRTITLGINAMAHAVESLYSTESNLITDALAEQGIARLGGALPVLSEDPQNSEARSDALFGAWACASCLGVTSMALHHKIYHTLGERHALSFQLLIFLINLLGGTFDLSHSKTHTNLGAPYSLKQLGMKEEDLKRAVDVAMKRPYPNPTPSEREKLLSLLRDAYEGKRPL
ncbi:iron-containing alcohol dehydrogenase [Mycena vulgaris]|nr:iron-containing alcohol dehydrogenase [Mycena vulgaris]